MCEVSYDNGQQVALFCLAVATLANPHRIAPSGYGYSAPKHSLSYAPHGPGYEAPQPSYYAPKTSYHVPSYEEEEEEGKPFEFEYAVQDHYNGLDFGHNENSDGTVVSGQYHVLLPDGRTQIVSYTADADNGYQAEVTYEGEAQYPEPHPHKPVALICLAVATLASPHRIAPSGYGYSVPKHSLSYAPHVPGYEAPGPSYSAPKTSYHVPSYEEEDEEGKPFEFEYAVQDHDNGLDFGHNENSDGTVVSGQYRVLLPDGRTQIVTYTADADNGYQAEVTYEGEAQYPESQAYKPAPSYHAPAHSYSAPAHPYSAPEHSLSPPAHPYSAPAHSYSAPSHTYG
ncbi:uncharacterized protein [Macrobrachium rosenbergii]|uniref:uncharacterized protein n=1 Tax=Macrobrachium rosenbergii TaxID=79674 RepID=UPI0034D46949